MIEKIVNIFRIPDLRKRIGITAALILIYRLGGHVPVPGINRVALAAVMEGFSNLLLGLYDIVDERRVDEDQRERAACKHQPDPSVIMTNQIIAGCMVDSYRMLLDNIEPANVFYDATSDERI